MPGLGLAPPFGFVTQADARHGGVSCPAPSGTPRPAPHRPKRHFGPNAGGAISRRERPPTPLTRFRDLGSSLEGGIPASGKYPPRFRMSGRVRRRRVLSQRTLRSRSHASIRLRPCGREERRFVARWNGSDGDRGRATTVLPLLRTAPRPMTQDAGAFASSMPAAENGAAAQIRIVRPRRSRPSPLPSPGGRTPRAQSHADDFARRSRRPSARPQRPGFQESATDGSTRVQGTRTSRPQSAPTRPASIGTCSTRWGA